MNPAPTTWKRIAAGWLLLLALIGLAILRSAWGTQLDTFTIDESYHIVAGVSYVRTGDVRLNSEHPPLLKSWVGAWTPDTVVRRLDEVVKALPWSVAGAIHLANARLRLGQRDAAIAAYAVTLSNAKGDLTRGELETALTRLRAGDPLEQIKPVRNPTLE